MLATIAALAVCQASRRYYWTPQDFGVQPQFIQQAKFFENESQRKEGRILDVGLTPLQFDWAINRVYRRMLQPNLAHVPSQSVAELARRITDQTDAEIVLMGLTKKPALLRKWLLAEAVCGWVSTHVHLDREWEKQANAPGSTYEDRFRRLLPSTTLGFAQPRAICSGFSRLTRDALRAIGLKAVHLGGENRDCGVPAQGRETHGWVFIDFGDGVQSVADTTAGCVDLVQAQQVGGKMHCGDVILPKSPIEWELFLGRFYATQEIGDVNSAGTGVPETKSLDFSLTSMSYADWMKRDTAKLGSVWSQYRDAEVKKVQYLNTFSRLPRD